MIFVSYYTVGVYEKVMQDYLLPTLKRWGLKYDISGIKDLGNWQKNTGFKCKFIKAMLLEHKEDICFLDADATVEKYPKILFNIPDEFDVAIHLLDWHLMWRDKIGESQRELLSGTMVVKYNERSLKLLDEWILQVEVQKNVKEQKVLEKILLNNSDYKYYDLPPSYCAIKKFDGTVPEYIGEPVILHHQISRLYKNPKKDKK